MEEKTEGKKEKRKLHLELSRTALFFWSLGFLIFMGWIFTLGVLAGRGLLPSGAETLAELKNQMAKLQEMVGRKDSPGLDEIKALSKSPNFAFYDELSSKEASVRPRPETEEMPKKSADQQKARLKEHQKTETAPPAAAFYVVQVASLDEEKQASHMVDRLVRKGYPAYHYKTFVNGRSYFRVRCGTFENRAEAIEIRNRLAEKEKLKGFVQKVDPRQ